MTEEDDRLRDMQVVGDCLRDIELAGDRGTRLGERICKGCDRDAVRDNDGPDAAELLRCFPCCNADTGAGFADALISAERVFRLKLNTSVASFSFSCVVRTASCSSKTSTAVTLVLVLDFVGFAVRVVLTVAMAFFEDMAFSFRVLSVLRGSLGGWRSHSRDLTVVLEQDTGDVRAFLMAVVRASAEPSAIAMVVEIKHYDYSN
jgi:hypothetical protein